MPGLPPIDLDTRRTGAALVAASLRGDTAGVDALTAELDDQALHDVLMCAVACATHCMRGTPAEQRLAAVVAGAAHVGDDPHPPSLS